MSARGRQLQPIRLMSFQGGEHEIKLFGDFDARGGLLLIEVPSIDFTATWAPTPKRGWRSWPPRSRSRMVPIPRRIRVSLRSSRNQCDPSQARLAPNRRSGCGSHPSATDNQHAPAARRIWLEARLGADYRPPSYTPIIPLAHGLPRGDSLAATFRCLS